MWVRQAELRVDGADESTSVAVRVVYDGVVALTSVALAAPSSLQSSMNWFDAKSGAAFGWLHAIAGGDATIQFVCKSTSDDGRATERLLGACSLTRAVITAAMPQLMTASTVVTQPTISLDVKAHGGASIGRTVLAVAPVRRCVAGGRQRDFTVFAPASAQGLLERNGPVAPCCVFLDGAGKPIGEMAAATRGADAQWSAATACRLVVASSFSGKVRVALRDAARGHALLGEAVVFTEDFDKITAAGSHVMKLTPAGDAELKPHAAALGRLTLSAVGYSRVVAAPAASPVVVPPTSVPRAVGGCGAEPASSAKAKAALDWDAIESEAAAAPTSASPPPSGQVKVTTPAPVSATKKLDVDGDDDWDTWE